MSAENRWRWLESTRELQLAHFGGIPRPGTEEFADYVIWNHTAAVAELGEALDEVGWKPWVVNRGWAHREALIKELVDANHFIGNLLAAVDCTDDEYEAAYQAKQEVNRARMRSGTYDGVSAKCPVCHRAYDDSEVRCRPGLHVDLVNYDDSYAAVAVEHPYDLGGEG